MTSTPWSVKGIDAKARETAKELARRSGMTLGEWLNERIREEGGSLMEERANSVSRALNELTGIIEHQEQRSTVTLSSVDQTVKGMMARLELSERDQASASAKVDGVVKDQQLIRTAIDERISRLEHSERDFAARAETANGEQAAIRTAIEDRLRKLEADAAGPRSAAALQSLETALGQVASKLQEGESRTRGELAQMRREIGETVSKLQAVETNQTSAEELSALAGRLDRAELLAVERLRTLEKSYAEIMRRLAVTEEKADRADPSLVDKKLDVMAANMARGLQAARSEMVKHIDQALSADSERVDQAIMDLTAHVQRAEKRSAQALEKMGHEVLRVAEVLNRRVQGVETRAAGAIQNMGGEIARVVDSLEGRLDRVDREQAESVEKIGGEIVRVAERLSERIGNAERRAAQAVDDVQDKLAIAAERLNQRHDRAQGDLSERIRLSEERTQRLLEEARDRIDRRLSDTQLQPDPSPEPAAETMVQSRFAEPASFASELADDATFSMAESFGAASRVIYPDAGPFGHTFAPPGFTPVTQQFDQLDIEAAQDLPSNNELQSEADFVEEDQTPVALMSERLEEEAFNAEETSEDPWDSAAPESADDGLELQADVAPVLESIDSAAPPPPAVEDLEPRVLTTRELVEQARAAARAASMENRARKKFSGHGASRGPSPGSIIGPIGARPRRRKDNGARTAMLVTLTGAVALVGASGYTFFVGKNRGEVAEREDGTSEQTPRAAIALDPKPITPTAPAGATSLTASALDPTAVTLFREGQARIAAKDNGGVEPLTRAANLGHPRAQFLLGQLYENGGSGLARNPAEARRWYERAAQRGDASAMHSTGLMYYHGVGGAQNATVAADWFKKAAELGLANSQFNIGQLFELGSGVTKNPAEAYKWYLLAARQGTEVQRAEARSAAERVKLTLGAEARATAERVANDVAARPLPVQGGAQTTIDLASVQMVLSRLGYYKGDANGVSSTALRTALLEFQRDNGISQSGQVDGATSGKLSAYTR